MREFGSPKHNAMTLALPMAFPDPHQVRTLNIAAQNPVFDWNELGFVIVFKRFLVVILGPKTINSRFTIIHL